MRVAIVDGQKLYDLDIETASREQRKSNVYKGKITGSSPAWKPASSITAPSAMAFAAEGSRREFQTAEAAAAIPAHDRRGTEVIVQVEKEEREQGRRPSPPSSLAAATWC